VRATVKNLACKCNQFLMKIQMKGQFKRAFHASLVQFSIAELAKDESILFFSYLESNSMHNY